MLEGVPLAMGTTGYVELLDIECWLMEDNKYDTLDKSSNANSPLPICQFVRRIIPPWVRLLAVPA